MCTNIRVFGAAVNHHSVAASYLFIDIEANLVTRILLHNVFPVKGQSYSHATGKKCVYNNSNSSSCIVVVIISSQCCYYSYTSVIVKFLYLQSVKYIVCQKSFHL